MNQNFSSQQLIKLVRRNELIEHDISKQDLIKELDIIFDQVVNNAFEFDILKVNNCYLTKRLTHKLVLRKLNDNIKRIYKVEQSNRRLIIQQVKTLLEETCPIWILKTDIKNFYESIDRERILYKLHYDSIISYHSLYLLKKVFSHPIIIENPGLPRGINLSSTLSELYMRNFDKWVSRFPGVYYYARFVDDILIFSNSEKTIRILKSEFNQNLDPKLVKNELKTGVFNGNELKPSSPLVYLGYSFTTQLNGKKKIVNITISAKKIQKIKSRITLALLDYTKNLDFNLLEKRIKFLTGNFSIRKSEKSNDLKAGIFYNYSQINNISILKELNKYLLRAINSNNNSFGRKLSVLLDEERIEILSKYSFTHGFNVKSYHSFTFEDMSEIVNCWK